MSSASNALVKRRSAGRSWSCRIAGARACSRRAGEPPRPRKGPPPQLIRRRCGSSVGIPLVAIALFVLLWSRLSAGIETSLGRIPGPAAVWGQTQSLWADHLAEREKRTAFYERQSVRNAARWLKIRR